MNYIDASIYDKIFEDFSEEDSSYIEEILKRNKIRENDIIKILDIGCGTGRIGKILSKRFYIIGLDIDRDMLNIAKSRIDVICCDISLIPIRSRSIDHAYSWLATLNYLTYTKLRDHVKEMNRIFKDSSIYIIDMVLNGFNDDYYEEYWKFKYCEKECLFKYYVRKIERNIWLETFIINCDSFSIKRSFIIYVPSYSRFRDIVDKYFNVIMYRPFTFNVTSRPAGRCVIILMRKGVRRNSFIN
ncbi:MAG: methyltransferase domain-containing protein [Crenarchaeota archaeon]|nr:methyltransferase domain-containing protein [Thermoproteota archaeon]